MNVEKPDLITQRLRLRLPKMSDAKRLTELVSTEYISVMSRLPFPYRKKDAMKWVTEAQKNFLSVGIVYYVIVAAETDEVIGTASAVVQYGSWTAEMGYWIGEKYWGKGFATEAAGRLLAHLVETMHLKRVYANAAVENTASQRVLEKIGMEQEQLLENEKDNYGRVMDVYVYAMNRE